MSLRRRLNSPAVGVAFAAGVAITLSTAIWLAARWRDAHEPGVVTLEQAWAAVQKNPSDPAAWAALGDAQAAMDEVKGAEHAYETSIRIASPDAKDAGVHARLGFLLYARGEDERALTLLEEADRLGADLPMLDETIMELRRRQADQAKQKAVTSATAAGETAPKPAEAAPAPLPAPAVDGGIQTGELDASVAPSPAAACSVPFVPSDKIGVHRVAVVAAGAPLLLVFDTGASLTTLTEEAIAKLGLTEDTRTKVRAVTASGRVEFSTAVLPSISVGNRVVRDLRVAVCRGCGGTEADGLLGLDVMGALGLELDLAKKRMVFAGCREY